MLERRSPPGHRHHISSVEVCTTVPNRPNADVTHAEDCVFRRSDTDADRPPPMRHPNVLGGFDVAEEELPPTDLQTRPYPYWRPRPRVASEQQKTLWGTASTLMQRAGC